MTWFNIFIHPQKYAREIIEYQELLTQHEQYSDHIEKENNDLKEQLALHLNNIEELQTKISTLNKTINFLTSQLSENSKELSSTREQLKQANNDLKLVNEIEDLFEKVKSRHENYEKRIKELNDALNDALKQIDNITTSHQTQSNKISTIDLSTHDNTSQNPRNPIQPETPSLFEKEEKSASNFYHNFDDHSSDDWLRPLPEDI